jgi:hypothetical protein
MMLGRLTCSTGHGMDGRGSKSFMHLQPLDVLDICWVRSSAMLVVTGPMNREII